MNRHGFACENPERDWIAMLADDPDMHLATGPLAPDNCDCEATCTCDNSTTVEASTEPRTHNPY